MHSPRQSCPQTLHLGRVVTRLPEGQVSVGGQGRREEGKDVGKGAQRGENWEDTQ